MADLSTQVINNALFKKAISALLFASNSQAIVTELNLSCHLIPLDYPGFSLEDIQDKTVKLSAADTSAKPYFSKNNHTFIIGVNRTDITDQPVILDFYLQIQPPAPAAPVRAYSASYFNWQTPRQAGTAALWRFGRGLSVGAIGI